MAQGKLMRTEADLGRYIVRMECHHRQGREGEEEGADLDFDLQRMHSF